MKPCNNFRGWLSKAVFSIAIGTTSILPSLRANEPVQDSEMAGYLLVPHDKVDESFNAGFSMYVAPGRC